MTPIKGHPRGHTYSFQFLIRENLYDSYSVHDAADILCMSLPDVLGWMEAGELEGIDTPHGLMLS